MEIDKLDKANRLSRKINDLHVQIHHLKERTTDQRDVINIAYEHKLINTDELKQQVLYVLTTVLQQTEKEFADL